ncbi:MAG: DUF1272 domain-containing protein [Verrucomicrobiota bacterium]|nr:DUF1272 domain-containing protein [Verrucomicrobiota bacterium]
MALQMKTECEKCGNATVASGIAFICAFECTFCETCAHAMNEVCPNCGGELVRRPRVRDTASSADS